MHFMARECFWRVASFDWRVVHRTYHQCVLTKDGSDFVALIGADAPILALAQPRDRGGWMFFDDASAVSAAGGYYSSSVKVLVAHDLNSELTARDREWLAVLGERMKYDLRYWNPSTVGEVVFNFWD